jgi:hypothetical protein
VLFRSPSTEEAPATDVAKPADAAPAIDQAEIKTTEPVADAVPQDQAPAAIEDAANADVAETAPVRVVKTAKIDAKAPVPETRPVDQPVNVVGTVTENGNVKEAAPAQKQELASADATPAAAPLAAGTYVIQVASLPSEAEAKASYAKLSQRFASVIGGRGVDIRRAEIKNKGTYYRVRIPAGSKEEAQALCSRYKAAGGSCLVSK